MLAESLNPGLDAYQRGDLVSAILAWEALETRYAQDPATQDEALLVGGLAELARGLQQATSGRPSDEALKRCRELLAPLPNRVLGVDVPVLRAACAHRLDRLLETPPPVLMARRFPPGTGRFVAFMALLLAGALAFRFTPLNHYLDREVAISVLNAIRGSIWAPIALLGTFFVLAPLGAPISPLILAGGAVFGFGKGALLNYIGATVGGVLSYLLARFLGRDFVVQIAGRKLRRVEATVSRQGFWSLAGIRLMPIPFPIANFGLALAGVRLPTFIATTAVGLTPGVLMYTYLATVLTDAAEGLGPGRTPHVVAAIFLFTIVGLSPTLWQQRKRRLRYQRLRRERGARGRSGS